MEITAKVFKRKSGKSEGKWTARVSYSDPVTGEARTIEKAKDRRIDAIDERNRLVNAIKKSHGGIREGERMTFERLADKCSELFYIRAVIVEGKKIEGVRSYATAQNYIKLLKGFFGKRRIGNLTTESLSEYRRWRLKNGSQRPEVLKSKSFVPVKLSTINRELSAMRRIMRYALSRGWITKDIFFNAKVIDTTADTERNRLLTKDEESRLLAACQGERQTTYTRKQSGRLQEVTANITVDNLHLKAIILLAVDAGMRRGEILKLRWQDIDFDANLIQIIGTHTKTEKERIAPLTERAKAELYRVRECTPGDMPFPFGNFKGSWTTAKRIAGIENLHFHDLRRTALTRWQTLGIPLAMAGKMAGHTNQQTTMKYYTATDADMIRDYAERMNAIHADAIAEAASGFVN